MRTRIALTAAAALTLAMPAWAEARAADDGADASQARSPRHQLLGDWRLAGGGTYRFARRRGRVEGRTRRALRLGGCTFRRGALVFRGYRFARRRGGRDVWRGRVAFVRDGCERVYVRSTITVESDLRFTEIATFDGRRRRSGTFQRIRPRVRADDPIVATWVRNDVGVKVAAVRGGYEGRAREAFLIANGCTLPAGTVIWRLTPLAPGRYDGTVQTYRGPSAGCRPGTRAPSRWRLDSRGDGLTRISSTGDSFQYDRG